MIRHHHVADWPYGEGWRATPRLSGCSPPRAASPNRAHRFGASRSGGSDGSGQNGREPFAVLTRLSSAPPDTAGGQLPPRRTEHREPQRRTRFPIHPGAGHRDRARRGCRSRRGAVVKSGRWATPAWPLSEKGSHDDRAGSPTRANTTAGLDLSTTAVSHLAKTAPRRLHDPR